MKNTVFLLLGVPFLLLGGCANSFGKVGDALNAAPAWYGERRAEIRGEGYPQIVSVPVLEAGDVPGKDLRTNTARARAIAAMFDTEPAARPAEGGETEILAIAAHIRQAFASAEPEASFLTEADIAAIRESFNVPRVTMDAY